MAVRSYYTR